MTANISLMLNTESIHRLMRVAGITHWDEMCEAELCGVLEAKLGSILADVIVYTDYEEVSKVNTRIVAAVIEPSMWSVKFMHIRKEAPQESGDYEQGQELGEVREAQRNSNMLIMDRGDFKNYIHSLSTFLSGTKWDKNSLILLQYNMEHFVVKLLQKAILLTIYAGRTTLTSDDIIYAQRFPE